MADPFRPDVPQSATGRVRWPQVRTLDGPGGLRRRAAALGIELPVDDEVPAAPTTPLARPWEVAGRRVGNRFAVLPMEGWDATADGRPTDLVRRRWRRFGASGAKLIWGGEAVAVRADGRANPHQLLLDEHRVDDVAGLRRQLVDEHVRAFGGADDLLVGLQLTHSGRFARPQGRPAPRVAYPHPVLDRRVEAGPGDVLTDADLVELADCYVRAAILAARAGFDFVDVKQCHGYLGHELLTAVDRAGPFGGDLDGRTRFATEVLTRISAAVPDLLLGVRLSLYDMVPFGPGPAGVGVPAGPAGSAYRYAFGGDGTGLGIDLAETHAWCRRMAELGVTLLCTTAGSPYYNPHIQRPAYFPPSDGYDPPEDPLVGVARMLAATREVAVAHPELVVVASGLSYLQEHLPAVGQAVVRHGWAHVVGLGRMALSYPALPADVLAGRPLDPRAVCRTLSDCTTAPRQGLVSGCYPLDPFYKERPERAVLVEAKRARRSRSPAAAEQSGG